MPKLQKGFTLIEVLMVVAIIAILSGIIMSSVGSSKEKSNRASAISSASSMMTELLVCADTGGFGYTTGAPTSGSTAICQATAGAAAPGATAYTGHTEKWPSLGNTGWVYATPTGTLAAGNYQYTLTKTGQTTITCKQSTGSCS